MEQPREIDTRSNFVSNHQHSHVAVYRPIDSVAQSAMLRGTWTGVDQAHVCAFDSANDRPNRILRNGPTPVTWLACRCGETRMFGRPSGVQIAADDLAWDTTSYMRFTRSI